MGGADLGVLGVAARTVKQTALNQFDSLFIRAGVGPDRPLHNTFPGKGLHCWLMTTVFRKPSSSTATDEQFKGS